MTHGTSDETADTPDLPYVALVDALLQQWAALAMQDMDSSHGAGPKRSVPQRAYLVFNRWDDNSLAQALTEQFPKWPRDRVTVPDSYFEHRPERAPCLLELPEELTLPFAGAQTKALREWLAHGLMQMGQNVNARLPKQDFCGVVISPASPQAIVRHWVALGHQTPPYQNDAVLFRYQDPRVMQRVWPILSSSQQSRWLGPATHWWSLLQPWGPITVLPEPPQWFHAKAPLLPLGADAGESPRDLFDETQWFISGVSPDANLIWRGYTDNHVPADAQPDADSMVQMLGDAARLGLRDLNIDDYVWTTWLHAPKEGQPRTMDWSLPHLAPTLNRIRAQLRDQPDARFSTLLHKIIQTSKG